MHTTQMAMQILIAKDQLQICNGAVGFALVLLNGATMASHKQQIACPRTCSSLVYGGFNLCNLNLACSNKMTRILQETKHIFFEANEASSSLAI